MLIPDILKINDFSFDISKNKSINVFSIQEIEKINQIIMLLKEELSKFTYELMKGISSDTINEFIDGKVPLSSCKMTYVWNYVSNNSFPSHVIKLHSQLTRVISEKNHISFDLRFIEFSEMLLRSFILDTAINDGHLLKSYTYQF